MKLRDFLPPPPDKLLPALRWLNISLRCLHLVGIAGISGGFLFDLPESQWLAYGYLALLSGGLLAALYVWTDEDWLWQLKGQVILAVAKAAKEHGVDLPFPTSVVLFHDQTEEVDGNRARQREGWPAGKSPPKSRFERETGRAQQAPAVQQDTGDAAQQH